MLSTLMISCFVAPTLIRMLIKLYALVSGLVLILWDLFLVLGYSRSREVPGHECHVLQECEGCNFMLW